MNKKMTKGICRLCLKEKELRISHIIPKLFYNQIKKNSITGILRSGSNPNVPTQDGEKTHFLCEDCEEKFSKYETWFSNNIYEKISSNKGEYTFCSDYDEFRYFSLSIGWRVLQYIKENKIEGLASEEYLRIDQKLEEWRKALNEQNMNIIREQCQYVIPICKLGYFRYDQTRIFNNVLSGFHAYGSENSFTSAFPLIQVPYLIFISMVWGKEDEICEYELGKKIETKDSTLSKNIINQLNELHISRFAEIDSMLSNEQRKKTEYRVKKKLGIE